MYLAVTNRFPNVSTVRVQGRHPAGAESCSASLAEGISAASLVTILAGLLVLAGAIAAGTRARLYDATILKVQGATRARIAAGLCHRIRRAGRRHRRRSPWRAGTLAAWAIADSAFWMFRFTFDAQAVTDHRGWAAGRIPCCSACWGAIGALSVRPARRLLRPSLTVSSVSS